MFGSEYFCRNCPAFEEKNYEKSLSALQILRLVVLKVKCLLFTGVCDIFMVFGLFARYSLYVIIHTHFYFMDLFVHLLYLNQSL